MLFLLSPAKTLDYDTAPPVTGHTAAQFTAEAADLIDVLRERDVAQIAGLMALSQGLAELNVRRYAAWRPRHTERNSKPAIYAFNGDVYEGLDAYSLAPDDIGWAQQHVLILSGLYGLLRPLDRMQPYRLEMGTRLPNGRGRDLYAYWRDAIARQLRKRLAHDGPSPVLVNLASEEYFRAVDARRLDARVVQCVFEDWKGGAYKVISFHAKRARGMMVRYAVQQRARAPRTLEGFDHEGYAFDRAASEPDRLVFRRRQP